MESRPKEARRRLQKAPNIADSRGDESPIYGERWLKGSDGRRNDLPKGVAVPGNRRLGKSMGFRFRKCICLAKRRPTGTWAEKVLRSRLVAAAVNEWATVEGVVAKVFTSKSGNTFLNIGAAYPNQTFTGWIPPASAVWKSPLLSDIQGKHVKITGRIELYKGKPEIRINAEEQLEVQ